MTSIKKIQVDESLCRDCQACALACSLRHEGVSNPKLSRVVIGKDTAKYEFHITICQHCLDPECVDACPVEALVLDDRGVVLFIQEDCIQCGSCAEACPYDAIYYNEAEDRYYKCEMCAGRAEGPLCTQICPAGALVLVDQEE